MKDYIQVSNNKKRSNLDLHINSFFPVLKFFLKLLFIVTALVFVFLIILISVWLFFPSFITNQSPKSFVYIFKDSDSEIKKIYYAHLNANANKMQLFLIENDYVFSWPNIEDRSISEGKIIDYLNYLREKEMPLHEVNSSWIVGRLVDETIIFEDAMYPNMSEENSDGILVEDSVKRYVTEKISSSSIKKSIQNWIAIFFADWDEPKIYSRSQSLPSTFSGDCSIAVLNATDISGYAQEISNIVEASGLRVIRVDSIPERNDQSSLAVSNKSGCQDLSKNVGSKLFNQYIVLNSEDSKDLVSRYRADIVIVLGSLK